MAANFAKLPEGAVPTLISQGSLSRTSNQHCVHNRLLDQPAGFYWIEIAEGDDPRSVLVQNVEPDAFEGASTILQRLCYPWLRSPPRLSNSNSGLSFFQFSSS